MNLSAVANAKENGGGTPDFQRTIELLNKYTIGTLQFINRFAAVAEGKLLAVNRQLHRLEAQVILLEYKLDSIDNGPAAAAAAETAKKEEKTGGAGHGAPALALGAGGPGAGGAAAPPPMALTMALPPGAGGKAPPVMAGFGSSSAPPLPPGAKMPPPPPGFAGSAGVSGPPPGAPPPGFMPPPPPPPMTNTTTIRNHAKLQGYFRMQQAGVPVAAIKAKMQVDGADPTWLDTPDAPAPPAAATMAGTKTSLYDSD